MDYILCGMRMDRKSMNQLTRMGKRMDSLLFGMRVDRKILKELTRMGNIFLQNRGTKMVRLRINPPSTLT